MIEKACVFYKEKPPDGWLFSCLNFSVNQNIHIDESVQLLQSGNTLAGCNGRFVIIRSHGEEIGDVLLTRQMDHVLNLVLGFKHKTLVLMILFFVFIRLIVDSFFQLPEMLGGGD